MSVRLKPVFSEEQIQERVRQMAAEIDAFYGDEPLVVVCVLKGAFLFFSDLVRHMKNKEAQLDFVRLSSYGTGTVSSGRIHFSKDVEVALEAKHVLLVEDVIDSGRSMRFLVDQFTQRGARSLRLAVLVDKRERREMLIEADFVGFPLPQGFIVGYGIDYREEFRALPAIYEVVL